MSFFTANKSAEAVTETSGSSYVSKSGIYPVTLKVVSVDKNDKGARSINFNVDYNGNRTTLYGLKLDNNDGTPNFAAKIFNNLCIIADLDTIGEPEMQTHKLGKDNKEVNLAVLTEFEDIQVLIRVQEEYSKWDDKINKRMVIKAFYREDGASAEEIVKGTAIGTQLEKDKKYAENVTYRDELTPEEVQAWKDSFKKESDNQPKAQETKASGPLFK